MLIAVVLNYGVYCGEVPENIRVKVAAVMQNLTPDQRWALQHRGLGYEQEFFRGSPADLENFPPSERAWRGTVHTKACQQFKELMQRKIIGQGG
jgi:hypothetical protein